MAARNFATAAAASQALKQLDGFRPAVRGLWSRESPSEEEMRALVKQGVAAMNEIREAILGNDAARADLGVMKLRKSVGPLREAAKLAE